MPCGASSLLSEWADIFPAPFKRQPPLDAKFSLHSSAARRLIAVPAPHASCP